jgi:hypothetical protein
MSYRRESRRLTQMDVDGYVEYAASENGVKGVMEIGDAKTVGLTLRIIPGKAVWYVRRREVTIRLGKPNTFRSRTRATMPSRSGWPRVGASI